MQLFMNHRDHLLPLGTHAVWFSGFVTFGLLFVAAVRVLYCDWLGTTRYIPDWRTSERHPNGHESIETIECRILFENQQNSYLVQNLFTKAGRLYFTLIQNAYLLWNKCLVLLSGDKPISCIFMKLYQHLTYTS